MPNYPGTELRGAHCNIGTVLVQHSTIKGIVNVLKHFSLINNAREILVELINRKCLADLQYLCCGCAILNTFCADIAFLKHDNNLN